MLSNAPERQRYIMDSLSSQSTILNKELKSALGVNAMTLWRDLVTLEEKGLIKRLHGRITKADKRFVEPYFHHKTDKAIESKQKIARYAVENFVTAKDNIAVDGGTTVAALANQALPEHLTVLTNSLHSSERFLIHASKPSVYACGGLLREQSGTFIGREALSFFRKRHPVRYFLSATGIDLDAGITDLTLEDNEVKQAMAASAKEVILLADKSKFGQVSLMQVFPWRRIHHFITDADNETVRPFAEKYPQLKIHLV